MCQKDWKDTEFCCVFAMKAGRWHSRWSYQALFTFNPYIRRWISLTVFFKWMETGKNIHQQYLIASRCPISTPKIVGKNCGHEPANTKTWFSSFLAQQVFDVEYRPHNCSSWFDEDHVKFSSLLSTVLLHGAIQQEWKEWQSSSQDISHSTLIWEWLFGGENSDLVQGPGKQHQNSKETTCEVSKSVLLFFWLQRGFSSSNFQCVSTKFLISKWVDRTTLF